jgi:hypothetical protein
MKTLRAFSALCLFVFTFFIANSQSSLIPKYEIGVHLGTFIYQGDLTPNDLGAFNTMKPGFGISATRILTAFMLFAYNCCSGSLKGDDATYEDPAWRQQRILISELRSLNYHYCLSGI